MEEDIYPNQTTQKCIYSFYALIYESNFSLAKKRSVMTAALGYEKWGWRVVGITKEAVFRIAENNFNLPKGLQRDHHLRSRKKTYDEIFKGEKLTFEKWWEVVWKYDETILMTAVEHSKKIMLTDDDVIKIDYSLGRFRSAVVGMDFSKRDGQFVRNIFESIQNDRT